MIYQKMENNLGMKPLLGTNYHALGATSEF